jgi:hypothetical protein
MTGLPVKVKGELARELPLEELIDNFIQAQGELPKGP